jgi:hypothetical protein
MAFKMKSPMLVRKTAKGAALRRWFKEKWTDEKGKPCGQDERVKVCRPSRRVSSKSPKPWSEMTKAEKAKVVRAKKKVGMGRRRSSSSNVA